MLLISNKVDGNEKMHVLLLYNSKSVFNRTFSNKCLNVDISLSIKSKIPPKKTKFTIPSTLPALADFT
jgi:hypothetical protein